jgi:hypothetical protein
VIRWRWRVPHGSDPKLDLRTVYGNGRRFHIGTCQGINSTAVAMQTTNKGRALVRYDLVVAWH